MAFDWLIRGGTVLDGTGAPGQRADLGLTAGLAGETGRVVGCFAKVLGTYVRGRGVLSWEAAVHKMTGQAAIRLGLPDRGALRPGAVADVVVFDPERWTTSPPTRRRVGTRPASLGCGLMGAQC